MGQNKIRSSASKTGWGFIRAGSCCLSRIAGHWRNWNLQGNLQEVKAGVDRTSSRIATRWAEISASLRSYRTSCEREKPVGGGRQRRRSQANLDYDVVFIRHISFHFFPPCFLEFSDEGNLISPIKRKRKINNSRTTTIRENGQKRTRKNK